MRLLKNFPTIAILLAAIASPAQDKITIRGSNTIGEELAPQLIAAYKQDHKNVTFDLEFKGSGYGIGALMGGYCDLAASSKPVSQEQEEVAQLRGVMFKDNVIGSYTVSLVVNDQNPVGNLSSAQVQALFTGKVANWREVGGPDAPVHLYVRDPVSGTYLGFKELAMGNQDYAQQEQFFTNYLGIADAVAKDPNGIGYVGLDLTKHAGTKAVTIDGIAPTVANINARNYPYVRSLRFYTNGQKESATTKDFLTFVLSPAGQKVLTGMGYAPKP